jgi:hypothetical protein
MLKSPAMNGAVFKRSHRRWQRRTPAGWRFRRAHRTHSRAVPGPFGPAIHRGATLLELVQAVQQQVASDMEVVAVVRWLVNSGAVVLTGSFAGRRF